jgi:hypothetical protein
MSMLTLLTYADRVTLWSEPFILGDIPNTLVSSVVLQGAESVVVKACPNPFNPTTTLTVSGWKRGTKASLEIFSITGVKMVDLSSALASGTSDLIWDAERSPSGIYIAQLRYGKRTTNVKISLIR